MGAVKEGETVDEACLVKGKSDIVKEAAGVQWVVPPKPSTNKEQKATGVDKVELVQGKSDAVKEAGVQRVVPPKPPTKEEQKATGFKGPADKPQHVAPPSPGRWRTDFLYALLHVDRPPAFPMH